MSKLLSLILAAGLLVYPFATYAADYGSQTSQNQQVPPVAQPLVREGDFAIKLATQLNLGSPTDEATAEDMLAKAGVVPTNGWISDYPVTPEIIGQINDSIGRAAETGSLPMGSDDAKKELIKLAGEMSLPLPAGPGSETAPGQPSQTGSTINNYYYQQGPPVITYYPPPADYLYLYDWVPFPAVWFGFGFSGFFIFHHFTAVVHSPFPHHFHHRAIVTDHFIDHRRGPVHVGHEFRTDHGAIRPHTVLRAHTGRTFANINEFRHSNINEFRHSMFAQNSHPGNRNPNVAPGSPHGFMNRPNAGPGMQRSFNPPVSNGRPGMGTRPSAPPSAGPRSFSGGISHGSGGISHGSGAGGFGHGGHAGGMRR